MWHIYQLLWLEVKISTTIQPYLRLNQNLSKNIFICIIVLCAYLFFSKDKNILWEQQKINKAINIYKMNRILYGHLWMYVSYTCPIPGRIHLNLFIQALFDSAVLVFKANSIILGLCEMCNVNSNSWKKVLMLSKYQISYLFQLRGHFLTTFPIFTIKKLKKAIKN